MFVSVFCLAMLLAVVPGCGPKAPATGKVSGKVTLKGAPVTTGSISLYSLAKGTGASSEFDAQGNFKMDKVPLGKYAVAVEPPIPEIVVGGPPKKIEGIKVPDKYADAATSGLSVEVKEGDNRLDLELK
ncbi:MAG: carboxypeptidase-like regulatory domain-containing protein [Thermoguttaceae bacterium]|nr:carboxypeptidase-like regulatory domain-containing protein [Thermoguttaceae bacterium]